MCRRAVLAAVLLAVAAAPLRGQVTEAELERRIDSLAPLVEQARIEAEQAQAARLERARLEAAARRSLDTLQVGGMRIIAPLADADAARELFTEVMSESFDNVRSPSLADRTFTYQVVGFTVDEIPTDGIRVQIVVPTWLSRAQAEARVRDAIEKAISEDLREMPLGNWSRANPFHLRDPAPIYRELVLRQADSEGVRSCFAGSVAACTSALGLDVDEGSIRLWYTAEEAHRLVAFRTNYDEARRQFGYTMSPAWLERFGPGFDRCIERDPVEACFDFMLESGRAWAPLPSHFRETLMALALRLGGTGAWARLTEDPQSDPADALAYAAGMPLDELVGAWRQWIIDGRPQVYAGLARSSGVALLWVVLFGAFAARSKRWRFE